MRYNVHNIMNTYLIHYTFVTGFDLMKLNIYFVYKDFDVTSKAISDSPVWGVFGYQTWAEGF